MDLTPIATDHWQACTDRAGYVGQIIKTPKTPKGYQALVVTTQGGLIPLGQPELSLDDAHDVLDVHCSLATG